MNLLKNISNDDLASRRITYSKLFSLNQSLGNLLTYAHFVDNTNLLLTTDGYICTGFKINLIDHSPMKISDLITKYKKFEHLFSLPEGTIFQFSLKALVPSTGVFNDNYNKNELSPEKILETYNKLREDSHPLSIISNKECFLYLKFKTSENSIISQMKKVFSTKQSKLAKKNLEKKAMFIQKIIMNYVDLNSGLISELTREELVHSIRNKLNIHFPSTPISEDHHIKSQVTFSKYKASYDYFKIDETKYKMASIKNYPSSKSDQHPDITIGHLIEVLSRIAEEKIPFEYFINGQIVYKDTTLSKLYGYKSFFLGANGDSNTFIERNNHRQELNQVSADLNTDTKYTQFSTHFISEDRHIDRLCSLFHRHLSVSTIVESHNASGIFLSSLPYQYHPLMDIYTSRSKLFRVDQLVHFLPLWSSFKGHKNGNFLVKNREDKSIKLNLKTSNAGHICVLGYSGSGKSTLINSIELNELYHDKNTYIFKIDSNTTSKISSAFTNTSYSQFTNDSFPMNPFSGTYNKSKIQFLTNFLLLAIKINNPRFEAETEHSYLLDQAIIHAYNQKSKKDEFQFDEKTNQIISTGKAAKDLGLNLDDIIAKMNELASQSSKEELKNIANTISSKLSIYYGNGIQSEIFKGENLKLDIKIKSYIYDFKSTKQDSPFLKLISMAVINDIESKISELKQENPSAHGHIIIEETGVFANNKIIKDYLNEIEETIRKEGFTIIFSFPRVQSIFKSEIGIAAFEMSEQLIIGTLGDDNVNDLVKSLSNSSTLNTKIKGELENSIFNEAIISLLKSLEKKKGKYAEFLYLNMKGKDTGIFRYYPTPLELWLSASGNSIMLSSYQRELESNNGDTKKTIINLCKKYPRGQ